MSYYFATIIDGPFGDAVGRVREALKAEGFGVISEIDVQKTLQEKIGAMRMEELTLSGVVASTAVCPEWNSTTEDADRP